MLVWPSVATLSFHLSFSSTWRRVAESYRVVFEISVVFFEKFLIKSEMNGDGDGEPWLSGWEQQCADSVDEQPDYEQSLRDESETSHTRIWSAFQDSAAAIAQLYRGKSPRSFL